MSEDSNSKKPVGLKRNLQKRKENISIKENGHNDDELLVETEGDDILDAINLVHTAESYEERKNYLFFFHIVFVCNISSKQREKKNFCMVPYMNLMLF
jgi:sugar-specific transcriptional regulator TrmB